MSELNKEEARKLLKSKVQEFDKLISECEVICDEHELSFKVCPTYGAGASYYGGDINSDTGDCWYASSQGC